ncbi:MAG: 23S rRNA (pseudouridine(1915)-N(3))-methyltransferase RlmH [Halobacteriovoraceae bacterium]|jgi:23S rRNA (pseudouridine1915-N3)-methyltransferase|nr:23S rRNA (pseudouridine(1915)-N(3))-methyltransferase RlmH [Halobacteriovoraceae bacterium]MBT5092710.1 23S rRNA (pseudouridine(1915)-N(3))-methyltransferase RlmH [Halobacteriovoraceae bacterium]
MKNLHLIVVGKLKDSQIEALEQDFKKRLTLFDFKIHELKSNGDDFQKDEDEITSKLTELEKTSSITAILMTENGKKLDSKDFAAWIERLLEASSTPAFIIGGAAGFSKAFKREHQCSFSLSDLTFPHKLARLLMVEQLYRAQSIIQKHPYHK